MVLGVLFDILALLFGVGMIGHAGSLVQHSWTLHRLGRTDTGAVEPLGLVAVEGTIQGPTDRHLTSPLQQEPGCLAKWTVEEYTGHSLQRGGGWTEFGTGYETVPFIVDDGTGAVTVEIAGEEALRELELELPDHDAEPVYEVGVTDTPPTHVSSFLREHDDEIRDQQAETSVPTMDNSSEQGDRRYYEQVLQTGDSLYVVGYATANSTVDPSEPKITICPPPEDATGPFYLSDSGRAQAMKRRLARIGVTGGLGVGVTWYGLAQFTTLALPL